MKWVETVIKHIIKDELVDKKFMTFIWPYSKSALLIITSFAEDGRVKYKISYEDKGRSLVSGHHIAFDYSPKPEQLFVGARVVVQTNDEKPQFCPGIVAELPDRKNRMRFVGKIVNFLRLKQIKMCLPFSCISMSWWNMFVSFQFLGSWFLSMMKRQSIRAYLHFMWCANHVRLRVFIHIRAILVKFESCFEKKKNCSGLVLVDLRKHIYSCKV